MERFFVSYRHSRFSYLKGGKGQQVLLCLHGFGEEAVSFAFLENYLGDTFTIYAIDFPWHGQTEWNKTLTFPTKGMVEVLSSMIENFENKKICLLCYSMGGRVGLSLLERIPGNIEKAVFLAPDGLKVNGWYWLATQTWTGNGLFGFTMRYPQWFRWAVDLLHRLNWVNVSVVKFVHSYIDDKKMRDDLYRIWTTMRKFRPNLNTVKKNITSHQIPVHLVFGEYDRVILPANGYRLQKDAENWVTVELWKSGHQLLREKNAVGIASLLK